jgi:hypothetical protein
MLSLFHGSYKEKVLKQKHLDHKSKKGSVREMEREEEKEAR